MAIFGPFREIRPLLEKDPRFAAAIPYIDELLRPGSEASARIRGVASGETNRHERAGGIFALEQAYPTRDRAKTFFESHRRFIDIQVVVEGSEVMEVENISRLAVTAAYDSEKDLIKYADTAAGTRLVVRAGDATVFFPEDGHMPTLGLTSAPEPVRKSVVKVPVAP
jgi:YhcH/YjgK/YiaL family protein